MMAEEDDALRERYLQLKHEKRAFEKQQEELETAYNDATDQSAAQAETIAVLERKLREQMQLAEDRAQDAEIAAKLNEDLEHMQTELSKTKQSLTTTSSELTQVKQVLADQDLAELDDSDVDLDADESEAGGLSSRGTSDAHAESEDDEPLDNQPLGVVVNPAMLLEQQEEIARLRDMLDEESHRRATLEQKVRTSGAEEDGLPDISLADEMGGMSLADEMSGGMSLAEELSAAPGPDPEHHHHHHHHHRAPTPEEEEDGSLPATPPPEPEVDPLAEDERLAMRLMAEYQEEELRRRRREQELLEQDARFAQEVNLTEEDKHRHRQDEAKRLKDGDERLARQVLSQDQQDIRKRQEDVKRLAQEDALVAQQIGVAQAQQAPPAAPRTPVANHGADALHWAFPEFDLSAIEAMLLANNGDQKKTQRELQELQAATMPRAAAAPRAAPPESFRDKQQELLRKKHMRAQQEADERAAEQAYRARMEKNFDMKQAAQRMPTPPAQQQQQKQPRKASNDFRIVLPSQERVFVALMQDDKDGNARRLGLGTSFDGRMAVKCTPSAVTLNPDVRRQHKMDDHAKRREWRLHEIKEVRYEAKVLFLTVWITSTHAEEFCFKLTENADSARDAYKTIHKFMTDATDRQDSSMARDLQKRELSDHWKGIDKTFMSELRFNEEFLEVLAKETGVKKQDFRDPFVFEQQLRRMGEKSEKKMRAVQKKTAKRESKMETRNQKIEQKSQKASLKKNAASVKKERRSKMGPGSDGFASSSGSSSAADSAYGYADAPATAASARLASSPLPLVPADTAAGAQHSDQLYDTDHLYATIDESGFAPPLDPRQKASTQAWL